MSNFYNATLIFVAFLMFQINAVAQKSHGSKSSDKSHAFELSFYKNTVASITSKSVDYFVELKNNSKSTEVFRIEGNVFSCEDAEVKDAAIDFQILDLNGSPLKKIKTSGNQPTKFIVRTTKLDQSTISWGCVEIIATTDSSSKQGFATITIKQLNPGASNFK